MVETRPKLIQRATDGVRESSILEFKRGFDLASNESTCETLKDIIAISNSGGGIIVFGVEDNGDPSDLFDSSHLLNLDLADLTNRILKYTNVQFAELEWVEITRKGRVHAALIVSESSIPIIFAKPGTYETAPGKQKTAFAQGTVYFRHGAKSEPGNRDDLTKWRDREVERIRLQWAMGIRKVVEAPAGHVVSVAAPVPESNEPPRLEARISTDPNATPFIPMNAADIWPWRQKDLLKAINQLLSGSPVVIGHDVMCINRKYDTLKSRRDFAYKPHPLASPQYNAAYAAWIVEQIRDNPEFINICRQEHRIWTAKVAPQRSKKAAQRRRAAQ